MWRERRKDVKKEGRIHRASLILHPRSSLLFGKGEREKEGKKGVRNMWRKRIRGYWKEEGKRTGSGREETGRQRRREGEQVCSLAHPSDKTLTKA